MITHRNPVVSMLLAALAVASSLGLSACAAMRENAPARPFDAMLTELQARYRLPGLVLGIVQDGKVIYRHAAGELIAGSGVPVTADTLFKIASNSKAMTTALLARLVESGKLRWDDPVTRHLPAFRLFDPWVTREMQVRDLLIHNSGLRQGAGDLLLWPEPNAFTRADIVAGLAHLEPVHSFRSRYEYDNLLYVVAGEVAAAAGGASYETLIRREVFEPLRMTRCQVGEWQRDVVGNVAQPHMSRGALNVPIRLDAELIPASTGAAAGGIRCSLDDMLKWISVWLDAQLAAAPRQPAWLTRAQRDVLWTAHMPMPVSDQQREWDGTHFNAYGYGWRLSDVDGVLRVAHTGTLAGMYSAVTLLPEQSVGFVFMTNGEGSEARNALNAALVKHFTRPGKALPLAYYADQLARDRREAAAAAAAALPPVAVERKRLATLEPARRLGIYRDPWFGELAVCERQGRIEVRAAKSPRLAGAVLGAGERLLVDWDDPSVDAAAWLEFSARGVEPVTLRLARVDPQADRSYDFEDLRLTRVRDCD